MACFLGKIWSIPPLNKKLLLFFYSPKLKFYLFKNDAWWVRVAELRVVKGVPWSQIVPITIGQLIGVKWGVNCEVAIKTLPDLGQNVPVQA